MAAHASRLYVHVSNVDVLAIHYGSKNNLYYVGYLDASLCHEATKTSRIRSICIDSVMYVSLYACTCNVECSGWMAGC